ncbi:hypothetical protein K2W90_01900 [Candidatus Babeliales bacterium]|nr:hypothetical protein [Candidatus Babeliales bacterium]
MYCKYYQAQVLKEKTWLVIGVFRNEDNVAFARALEGRRNVIEFFVPDSQEEQFLHVIDCLMEKGAILSCEEKPNRIKEDDLAIS